MGQGGAVVVPPSTKGYNVVVSLSGCKYKMFGINP